jgi:hypothetical protein
MATRLTANTVAHPNPLPEGVRRPPGGLESVKKTLQVADLGRGFNTLPLPCLCFRQLGCSISQAE